MLKRIGSMLLCVGLACWLAVGAAVPVYADTGDCGCEVVTPDSFDDNRDKDGD